MCVLGGFLLAFALGAVNEQVNAGRAVAAFLFGLGVRWTVVVIGKSSVLTWIYRRAKVCDDYDGFIAWSEELMESSEKEERRRKLIDEEFLTQVHWEELHRRVRAEFRRYARESLGSPRHDRDEGEEVKSDGEEEEESE
jgi:hypothetical protein